MIVHSTVIIDHLCLHSTLLCKRINSLSFWVNTSCLSSLRVWYLYRSDSVCFTVCNLSNINLFLFKHFWLKFKTVLPTISFLFYTMNMAWNDSTLAEKFLDMIKTYPPNTNQQKLMNLTGITKLQFLMSCCRKKNYDQSVS